MKKIFKPLCTFICLFTLLCSSTSVQAEDSVISTHVECLENGGKLEVTIIEHNANPTTKSTSKTKSASKVVKYRDSKGTVCWSVTVTGTFPYNGSTSKCTASKVSASSNNSNWRIASKSSSRSGNTASATATAKRYNGSSVVQTVTRTVKLSCSKTGVLS